MEEKEAMIKKKKRFIYPLEIKEVVHKNIFRKKTTEQIPPNLWSMIYKINECTDRIEEFGNCLNYILKEMNKKRTKRRSPTN